MRISNEWLRDFVELPDQRELDNTFEMAGLGVENYFDDVWSLEVTSNRGDCLSAIGLAREISAMTGSRLRLPTLEVEENGPDIAGRVQIEIENPDDCTNYVARLFEIELGPSPDWMQQRLIECGMRPINNVVDITNYVMLETGQPLHAFDAAQVLAADGTHRIVVRRAREGEALETLDGVTRTLNAEILVIADSEKPIAIAGIMGGAASEVTENTTQILLESAHFAPSRIRRGKRILGLNSEAARRYERHVDPNNTRRCADRAAQLLARYAGAKVARGVVERIGKIIEKPVVTLRPERCNAVLGLHLKVHAISDSLQRLGLQVTGDDNLLSVTVPTWRGDIEREIDLIEEVARIHGYSQIPNTLPHNANPTAGRSLAQRLEGRAREALGRCGLSEIVTYSLESAAGVERAGMDKTAPVVRLRNPLSEDYAQLRTSILPSLLEVLGRNARTAVRFFELARVYEPQVLAAPIDGHDAQPYEKPVIGLTMLNAPTPAHWQKQNTEIDFYTLKAVIETLLQALGAPRGEWLGESRAPFHPGRCATLQVNGQEIGVMGEVHPAIAENYDLQGRAYLAELDFDALIRHVSIDQNVQPIARFPVADRDIALVLRRDLPASQVETTVRAAAGELLESARVFDVYTGPPMGENEKSLAIALKFRAPNRTLTDDEVEAAMARIREAANAHLNAQIRS